MPKFYCEYCGIYLTHSSPSGRKQHSIGRKHIQSKIDYYTQLLIEAHQEGDLDKITNIFKVQDNMPNLKGDMIRNPINNKKYNTNDISSINLAGLKPSNISFLPLPGLNAAIPINPNDQMNIQKAYQNLLPTNILDPLKAPVNPINLPPPGMIPGMPMPVLPNIMQPPTAAAGLPQVGNQTVTLPENLVKKEKREDDN